MPAGARGAGWGRLQTGCQRCEASRVTAINVKCMSARQQHLDNVRVPSLTRCEDDAHTCIRTRKSMSRRT